MNMYIDLDNLFKEIKNVGAAKFYKDTGTSSGNVSDWRSGRSYPGAEKLISCAEYFDCSVDYLLGRTQIRKSEINESSIIYLPVFEQKASAGIGKEASIDDSANYRCFDSSKVPSRTTHGIIIEGHSMEPRYLDGQIVFIDVNQQCFSSDCGIFSVTTQDETKVYCKQLKLDKNGREYLHSINKAFGDPEFRQDEFTQYYCIGKIVG
nr:MAG TPA: Repressor protein CI [Caudoviricetes sp.]